MVLVVGDDQPLSADGKTARVEQPPRWDDLGRAGAIEVEALEAVVEAVGDEQEVARRHQAAAGRRVVAAALAEVELAHAGAAAAEGAQQVAGRVEAIDPVAAVGDEERVVGGDGDRADRRQLARARARPADLAPEGSVLVEDLDDARGLVGDVDRPIRPDRDRLREAQHPASALTDLRREDVRAGRRRAGTRGLRLGRRGGDERGEQRERDHAARNDSLAATIDAGHRRLNHGGRR